MVDAMHPSTAGIGGKVVRILGGVGNASTQYQAMLLAQRMAGLIGASPVQLRRSGPVGDNCFQFMIKLDWAVESPLMKRLIGIDLATLNSAPRVVGIACGHARIPAITADLKGKWINVLIPDRRTAQRLISNASLTASLPSHQADRKIQPAVPQNTLRALIHTRN